MPYVKGVDRNQTTLFPESIEDYIRVVNILGVEEMVKRLQERGKPVLV